MKWRADLWAPGAWCAVGFKGRTIAVWDHKCVQNRKIKTVEPMRKPKIPPASLAGNADDIEAAFYDALQNGDIEKLMACWGDDDDIICIHPGGARLIGVATIRAAFEAMFSNGAIHAYPEKVRKVESLSASVHSVLERIEVFAEGPRVAYVVATNVYHKAAQGWRLVAHHASPGTPREMQEVSETPTLLH